MVKRPANIARYLKIWNAIRKKNLNASWGNSTAQGSRRLKWGKRRLGFSCEWHSNSGPPKRGHWFALQANQWVFKKRKQKKIELVAKPAGMFCWPQLLLNRRDWLWWIRNEVWPLQFNLDWIQLIAFPTVTGSSLNRHQICNWIERVKMSFNEFKTVDSIEYWYMKIEKLHLRQ